MVAGVRSVSKTYKHRACQSTTGCKNSPNFF
jgi:hypothetical protein